MAYTVTVFSAAILGATVLLLALAVLALVVFRAPAQRRAARALAFTTGAGIVESGFVLLGGIAQWVSVRGEDRTRPLLLLIHGGPGAPYSVLEARLADWEHDFTIVQWDQRGAGRTFGRHGGKRCTPLTFNQLADDGLALAEHLRARFGRPIVLVGSLAGSITALRMAAQRPDLFTAFVATDFNVGRDAHGFGHALRALHARGDHATARKLEATGPCPTRLDVHVFETRNRLLLRATQGVPDMVKDVLLPAMLSSPSHGLRDLVDLVRGMRFSQSALLDELLAYEARAVTTRLALPFYVFHGDTDWLTSIESARAYFDEVEAPLKAFATIERAGHLAAFAYPDRFLALLREHVLPHIEASA
jgi:pimeloyl-ACP methyl ester carboxylesterase